MKTVLLFLLISFFAHCKPYTCQFGKRYANSDHYISAAPRVHEFLMPGRMLSGSMQQMRITLNTDNLDTLQTPSGGASQTTTARLNFLKQAALGAAHFYSSRLKVSSEASIAIPSTCIDFSPPSSDVTNGIAGSDLHIYVRYLTDDGIAYGATAAHCLSVSSSVTYPDTTLRAGKPIAGRMILNTYNLIDQESSLSNRAYSTVISTILHQMMHILGFNQQLYSLYMLPSGSLHTSILQSTTLHANRSANYLLKLPFITTWAKNHFGCDSLTGMILENQESGSPTYGSHWERLAMYDQIMTGTSIGAQKSFTGLTFALLKDMGWYEVDDTFNDTTNYGYGKGCSFVNQACYATTPDQKYFCSATNFSGISQCSTTFTGKAVCTEQSAAMADGCGIFVDYFYCTDPDQVGDGNHIYTLETFGTNSFCVKGTMATVGVSSSYRGRCYPYLCNYEDNSIKFTIGAYQLFCLNSEEGTQKNLNSFGMQGYVECPIFADFCTNSRKTCPNWCSQHGFCTRGICNCYSDNAIIYSGQDCSITSCASLNQYYNPSTSTCSTTCPSGTYSNSQSRTCVSCDSACSQCRDEATICTSCSSSPNPMYFDEQSSTCVSTCPSNTFKDTDDRCKVCDSSVFCATCQTSATNCLSCTSPYYLNTGGTCTAACSGVLGTRDIINMQCVATCPNELYTNTNDGTCEYCPDNKYLLLDGANTCTATCVDGTYTDTVKKVCGICDSTCDWCFDQYAQNCTKCKTTGVLNYLYEGMCVEACPDGQFANTVTKTCEICEISLFCKTCSYHSGTLKCDTCKYGYYLHSDNTCSNSCDPTTYRNTWNQSCDSCHTDCKDCQGPSNTQCLNCDVSKYFLSNSTGGYCLDTCPSELYVRMTSSCESCHQSCLTCSGLTSADCQSCHQNYFLEDNKCRYVCSPGKYSNTSTFTCENCDSQCAYCFGSTIDNCTKCNNQYYLNNFTCQASCPENYQPNTYNVCELKNNENSLRLTLYLIISLLFLIVTN